jgi:choline dehydrogenase-like flavoprotein
MTLFDAIVVGSGPAGTFAAYSLRGKNVLVLDVGYQPPPVTDLDGNLFKLRQSKADLFRPLIGENFESLHNLHRRTISLKLKAPFLSYIVKDSETFAPTSSSSFEAVSSFAQGGLANAWGAGVYRFTDSDLREFPVRAVDLKPFYDELTTHIGVCGAADDLVPYFGECAGLL